MWREFKLLYRCPVCHKWWGRHKYENHDPVASKMLQDIRAVAKINRK